MDDKTFGSEERSPDVKDKDWDGVLDSIFLWLNCGHRYSLLSMHMELGLGNPSTEIWICLVPYT